MPTHVHIEEKDWESIETAERLLGVLIDNGWAGRWLDVDDAVRLSGIPRHLCEPALMYLGSSMASDVRVADTQVEFLFESFQTPPDLLRYPRAFRPLLLRIKRVAGQLRDYGSVAATSLFATLIGLLYIGVVQVADISPDAKSDMTAVLGLVTAIVALPSIGVLVLLLPVVVIVAAMVMDPEPGHLITFFCCWAPLLVVSALLVRGSFEVAHRINRALAEKLSGLFNFGRERVGDLDDERAFLDIVAERDGRVTIRDLVALFGWPVHRAQDQLNRLLLDYGGDIEVTDEGVIVFVFSGFSDADASGTPDPIWEREKPPLEVYRDNHGPASDAIAGGVFVVGAFGLFELLSSLAIQDGVTIYDYVAAFSAAGKFAILGVVLSLAALPMYLLARQYVVRRRQDRYSERESFLELIELAVETPEGTEINPDEFSDRHLAALDAKIDVERGGDDTIYVSFPALRRPASVSEPVAV